MKRGLPRAITLLAIVMACSACAFGVDPSLEISQYAHTSWKVRDGFAKGFMYSIAQTPDGYLWLGTEFGLLRFDGMRAVPWQPPSGQELPGKDIPSLLVSRDGTLWIGTYNGLARWKDGKLTTFAELSGLHISSLLQDRDGVVWIGTKSGKLCNFENSTVKCVDDFGEEIRSSYEDSHGNLLFGVSSGVWTWKQGRSAFFPLPKPIVGPSFGEYNRTTLIGTATGLQALASGRLEPYRLPGSAQFSASRILCDRDGGLWIGTENRGLLHSHQGRTDTFLETNGLSGDTIRALFQDREGNIWVVTPSGIDRFRTYAITNIGLKQGLSNTNTLSILASKDGSVWIGTYNGLDRWQNGRISVIGKSGAASNSNGLASSHSLFQDSSQRVWVSSLANYGYMDNDRFVPVLDVRGDWVHSVTEAPAGHLWLAKENEGLLHLSRGKVVHSIQWSALGHRDHARVLLADLSQHGFWLGFAQGGVAYFAEGRVQKSYSATDGLGQGRVNHLRFGPNGGLWAATEGGLSRIKDGHIITLTSKNGLPCDAVHWSTQVDAFVWIDTACGLARVSRPEVDAWIADATKSVRPIVFDISDGVASHSYPSEAQAVTKLGDGRIWFVAFDGVSVIDPEHLPFNNIPPPVQVEKVTADDKTYDVAPGMRLPAGVRSLAIDYTALSLVVPEKVRFRYKLDGVDQDWREVVNDREVQYSNLGPATYHFHVLACNNGGVWNQEGASLDFVIPPMWYQTNWFRAACIALFFALLWAMYELRVRQLAHEFNVRLGERVAERTRIARELHDTLLQSFQGLLLRFQAAINLLPARPVEARKVLEDALDRASEAITQGRDAIGGLRMSTIEKNDLAVAIETIAEELAAAQGNKGAPAFHVLVEGTSCELHPIMRDEIYRIATEALRNAFQHAAAKKLEVEIRYDPKYFRLRVRDDGKGIDPSVVDRDGVEGHYGLPGMRERAKLVAGKLTIWTELGSGTEIELVIPGAKAYVKSARPFWYFRKHTAAEADEMETIDRE